MQYFTNHTVIALTNLRGKAKFVHNVYTIPLVCESVLYLIMLEDNTIYDNHNVVFRRNCRSSKRNKIGTSPHNSSVEINRQETRQPTTVLMLSSDEIVV